MRNGLAVRGRSRGGPPGAVRAGDAGEVRPEPPVEEAMRRSVSVAPGEAWTVTGRRRRPTMRSASSGHVLHVVEVGVGEEDVVHPVELGEIEARGERARVERQPAVDEEAGAAVAAQLAAGGPQDPDPHGRVPGRESSWSRSRKWRSRSASGTVQAPSAPARSPGALQGAQHLGRLLRVHVEAGRQVLGRERRAGAPGWRAASPRHEVDHPGPGVAEEQVLDLPVGLGEPPGQLLDHPHRDLGAGRGPWPRRSGRRRPAAGSPRRRWRWPSGGRRSGSTSPRRTPPARAWRGPSRPRRPGPRWRPSRGCTTYISPPGSPSRKSTVPRGNSRPKRRRRSPGSTDGP